MRLIDADKVKEQINQMKTLKPSERMSLRLALDRTPTYEPPNLPLTMEELREMDGEPVWVKPLVGWKTEPFWAIVHGRDVSDGRLSNDPERCVLSLGDTGAYWTDWLAYRRKEDVIDNA